MPRHAHRGLAMVPIVGLVGACLTAYSPRIRAVDHHAGITAATPNATCMACHDAEVDVMAEMARMSEAQREHEMAMRMGGGGASLVAQWMVEDERSCATCHKPFGGQR